jgi:hydroxyacylglutathione hydrolase
MDIHLLPILSDNYAYILRSEQQNFTAVIDPGEAAPIIEFLDDKGWGLDMVINTHHHGDHIEGNSQLLEKYSAKLAAPTNEIDKIGDADIKLDETVKDFTLAGEEVQIFDTPGHTAGHITLYLPQSRALFAGDTLFSLGCGRIFEGTHEQMYESISKLKHLPDETRLFCGHEYTQANAAFALDVLEGVDGVEVLGMRSQMVDALRKKGRPTIPVTMGLEKQTNPFLIANDLKTFKYYRTLKDNF